MANASNDLIMKRLNRFFFSLIILTLACFPGFLQAQQSNFTGYWEASMEVGSSSIRIWMTIHMDSLSGAYRVKIDSPDQLALDLPVEETTVRRDSLGVKLPKMMAEYNGQLKDNETIKGTWTQMYQNYPLIFKRSLVPLVFNRPQMPVPPFPYEVDSITFPSANPKVRLSGTITRSTSNVLQPAAILISGSGAQDRDCSLASHKSFWVIADFLSRNGIAVLRFDDRGVGASEGNFAAATSFDFADDVSGAVDFLKKYPGITPEMIGLIGHSEGGMIAPIVASKRDDLAFVILIAGPASSGYDILIQQTRAIMQANGSKEKDIRKALETNSILYTIAKSNASFSEAKKQIEKTIHKKYWYLSKSKKKENHLDQQSINQISLQILSDWFRAFLVIEPKDYLVKLSLPVLAIYGEKDVQVIPDPNHPLMEKYLQEAGNKKAEVITFPELNHLMQHATTGAIGEYAVIEETFAPEVLQKMLFFIQQATHIRGRN